MKIGILGCGIVTEKSHLPTFPIANDIERTVLYDPKPDHVRAVAKNNGFALGTSNWDEFWNARPDTLLIASPASRHLQNVRDAAAHGIRHILCEKPLTDSNEDDAEMLRIAQENQIRIIPCFCYRFGSVSTQIRTTIRSGAIGSVRSMRLVFNWDCHGKNRPDMPAGYNKRRHLRMLEGGPLVDCGIHLVDLLRFWTGAEPVAWTGFGAWADSYVAPDHVWAHITLSNGAHAMTETSFSYGQTCKNRLSRYLYEIIGTDGVIRYDRDARLFECQNEKGSFSFPIGETKDFGAFDAAYLQAVRTDDFSALPAIEDAILAGKIVRDATRKAIENRPASLPPPCIPSPPSA